jgi:3-hydroxyacyl-CoA dehydrogenase
MAEPAQYQVRDGIAVITMNSPPVNGMGYDLRVSVMEGLRKAEADASVRALILTGTAKAFSGGADIREFNTPKAWQTPSLRDLNDAQDKLTKPLVGAIGGFALGGGLELALGCHYRVAAPRAQLGLPEVKLGLLPGSGGTQRLPRVVPVADALKMMTSGAPITSEKALEFGLVDEVTSGDLLEGALAFAKRLVADGKGPRRIRDMKAKLEGDAKAFFEQARAQVAKESRGHPAPLEILACIEASVNLPFDQGIKEETTRFHKLEDSVESKAMRHMFFAERQTTKIPDIPEDLPLREIRQAAIIGAGTMGGGITMSLVNVGIPVTLIEVKQEALDRGLETIRKNYAMTVSRGRLDQADMDRRMALITPKVGLEAAKDADIIIEAVFERMDVKEDVFRKLDKIARPGAILATNTSMLDVNRIAAFTSRPQDVVGTHFFSPANVMRLLEVVRAEKTAKDVLATTLKLGKAIKKVPVVSGVCDGFIGNRMLEKYSQQAMFLLDEGATPWQVDNALQNWGLAMGVFAMWDLAGNDIGYDIRKRRYVDQPEMFYPKLADRVVELGRYGQKTGKGWYVYDPATRKRTPDPEIEKMLVDYRKEIGVIPRQISDEEIIERCMFALANEGAHILEEGIALRASDIDMVYLTGYGFPAYRGGPMFHADTVGLAKVLAAMEHYARGYHGDQWKISPLLRKLATDGKSFNG